MQGDDTTAPEDQYAARKALAEEKIAGAYGVSPEELALIRELAPDEVENAYSLVFDPVLQGKKAFDILRGTRTPRNLGDGLRAARDAEKAADAVNDVIRAFNRIF